MTAKRPPEPPVVAAPGSEAEHPFAPGSDFIMPSPDDDGSGEEQERKSQATVLADLICAEAELWHSPGHEPFATVEVGLHREHLQVRSKAFKMRATRKYRDLHGRVPPSAAMSDALVAVEASAAIDGPEHEPCVRVAGDRDAIYVDLGDADWRAVEITALGWRVIDRAPVRFVRRPGMQALPEPIRGGVLDDIRVLHPVLVDDHVRALVLSWLVGFFRPWASYAILAIIGEHGSGKSWLARQCALLVDPTDAGLRSPPRNTRDLAAAVRASRTVILDNVGRIRADMSDALCLVSTGGTFAARRLYSDADEVQVKARQPVLITAIGDVIDAGDLRDRSLVVRVPPLEDEQRADEEGIEARITDLAPRLLGALFDAVAKGLRNVGDVRAAQVHRLADHVRWAIACDVAPSEVIGQAHRSQREEAVADQLADPIGSTLLEIGSAGWVGSLRDLHSEMGERVGLGERPRNWPKTPRGMGNVLRKLAPALRRAGIEVEELGQGFGPKGNLRGVSLQPIGHPTSATSGTSGDRAHGQQSSSTLAGGRPTFRRSDVEDEISDPGQADLWNNAEVL